ncbi:MAG: choice-of-anchor D domain-containing protein [Candidatus Kapaibacteriota bacterium]
MNIINSLLRKTIFIALCMSLVVQVSNAQSKRRAYIEKYTGAWCQYCPNGAVAFDEIGKQYTDEEVIMVAVHQNDGMSMTNQGDFQPYINGVPSGSVSRIYNAVGPQSWASYIPGIISQDAAVEVNLKNVSFNSGTRRVTCQLEARINRDITGPVRVNVVVVEDSVVGTGSQFDQVNAFNTQQGHPFYQRGNPIKNYPHRHVARLMVDGTWGATGVIPDNPKAGAVYTKNYSFTVNASWKPERMSLVGLAQKYSNEVGAREIYQAVEESLLIRSTRATLEQTETPYLKVAAGGKKTQVIKVTNDNNFDLTFDLAVNDSKSTLPFDWTASVEPATVQLAKGASADVTVTINAPASISEAELATVVVDATPQPVENTNPKTSSTSVYALPDFAKAAVIYEYNTNQSNDLYRDAIKASERFGRGFVTLPNNATLIEAYKDQFHVYVYSVFGGGLLNGQIYGGLPIGTTTDAMPLGKTVSNLLSQGKRVYLSAPQSMWWAFDKTTATAAGKNQDVISFFNNTLKLQFVKTEQRYTQSGNSISIKQYGVKGFDNDSIGDQFNGIANATLGNYTFFTDIFRLASGSPCSPVLYSDNSNANIVGVRYTSPEGGKLVFVTHPIEAHDNMITRETFMQKSLEWLAGDIFVQAKKPILALNSEVKFGSLEIGQKKQMTTEISNTGDGDLNISAMGISGSSASVFSIIGKPELPIILKPGEKTSITLEFVPTTVKSYLASLDFTSNDGGVDNSTTGIDLVGEGVQTVPDPPALTGVTDLDLGQTTTKTDKPLTLTNNIDGEIKVTGATITGDDKDAFTLSVNQGTVPKGQRFQTRVFFNPTKDGIHKAVLTLNTLVTSTGKTGTYTVNLVGEKQAASGVKEDMILTSSVQIMPNPTANYATVSFTIAEPTVMTITITSMNGELLYTAKNRSFDPGSQAFQLPVSNFAAGRYTVTLRSQSGATVSMPFSIVR